MKLTDQTNLVITLPTISLSYRGSALNLFSLQEHLCEIEVSREVVERFTLKLLTGLNPPHSETISFVFVAPPLETVKALPSTVDMHFAAERAATEKAEYAVGMLLAKHGFTQVARLPPLLLK